MAVLFAIAGVWSAIGFDVDAPPNALRGDIIMAIGTAFSAAYTAFAKRYVMKYDGVAMTAWSMFFGAFALFVVAMIFGAPFSGSLDLSLKGWGALMFLAVPGGAFMMWCFISGFRLVTPTQAAVAVGCRRRRLRRRHRRTARRVQWASTCRPHARPRATACAPRAVRALVTARPDTS